MTMNIYMAPVTRNALTGGSQSESQLNGKCRQNAVHVKSQCTSRVNESLKVPLKSEIKDTRSIFLPHGLTANKELILDEE